MKDLLNLAGEWTWGIVWGLVVLVLVWLERGNGRQGKDGQ